MKLLLLSLFIFTSLSSYAKEVSYSLTIDNQNINITGKNIEAMTVNGSVPGPTLTFTQGDTAKVSVTNLMSVETSVHWHGLILPNFQDGVPYLTTPPIRPGQTLNYSFPLKHAGTYWYHSHTGLQEQLGVYGSIVIRPKKPHYDYDRDLVLVLSDWTNENPAEVLRTLKRGSEWYSIQKKSAVSLSEAVTQGALKGLLNLWRMRMPGIDIADIAYDAFLINGQKEVHYKDLRPGEKVRLRVINASSSTFFWTTAGDPQMQMISADGMNVEPIKNLGPVLHAVAETYDYLLTIPKNGSIEFRSFAQDGSGGARAILGQGAVQNAPIVEAPNYINRTREAESMSMDMGMDMSKMDHSKMDHSKMDHSKIDNNSMRMEMRPKTFSYEQLRSLEKMPSTKGEIREVKLNLTGNMWRYVWSLNGKTLSEADKIQIRRGETVRITMNNMTMMHHPMHLHGHFFRVLNSQGEYSPLKHTVDVAPMSSVTIEFPAKESGDWFFHCHVLYHMKGGMARVFSYGDKRDERLKDYPLSNLLSMDEHWFTWTDLKAASHFSSFELTSTNTRNQVNLGAEYGWNKNLEADFSYDRFLSDYFRVYIGANSENKVEEKLGAVETVGTLGMKWLLPYFIDTDFRIDSDLKLRLAFDIDYLLFPRTGLFARWEVTNDFGWKDKLEGNKSWDREYVWSSGLEYIATKDLSVFASYDTRFGAGAGLSYVW